MANAFELWFNFFQACDIPNKVSEKYAQRFVKERIQPYLLKDMQRKELNDLGCEVYGDQLAIMNYIKKWKGNPPEFLPPEFGVRQQKAPESDEELDDYEMELDESPPSVPKVASRVEVMRKEADTQDSSQLRGITKRVGESRPSKTRKPLHQMISVTNERGLSNMSKTIQKQRAKHVQSEDVSSSSLISATGMRSDSISLKTMVISTATQGAKSIAPPERHRVAKDPQFAVNMSLPSFRRASSNTASTRRMVNYGDLNDLHVALPEEEEIEVETLRRTLDQRVEVISGPSARALESAGIRQRPVVTRFTDSRTSSRPYNNGRNSGGFRRPTTSNKRGGRLGGRTTRIGGRFQPKNSILERISFG